MGSDLEAVIWAWLPARSDRRRVTDPAAIAAGVGAPPEVVHRRLLEMESGGHAIRDRRTGRRASSWHRGLPPAGPPGWEVEGLWS